MNFMIDNKEKREILMKNNELIENKIFMMMLFKLKKSSNNDMTCEIPRSEFTQVIDKISNSTVDNVESLLEKLLTQKINFKILNDLGNVHEWIRHSLINGYGHNKEKDSFTIYCSQIIYELFISYFETDKNERITDN